MRACKALTSLAVLQLATFHVLFFCIPDISSQKGRTARSIGNNHDNERVLLLVNGTYVDRDQFYAHGFGTSIVDETGVSVLEEEDIFDGWEPKGAYTSTSLNTRTTTAYIDERRETTTKNVFEPPYPEVASLPVDDFTVCIHVFAWKRSLSLERLFRSLTVASYDDRRDVELVIHVDGESTPEVAKVVKDFVWPYGTKRVKQREMRVGLREIIMSAWAATEDHQYAIFLEDDISVSPLFFQYTIWCLRHYLHRTTDASLMGCSLYTPRVDEISPTDDPQNPPYWTPQNVTHGTLLYIQLPCSWGAVWRADEWRTFRSYYERRREIESDSETNGTEDEFPPAPNSRSNGWRQSWKRYLIEYMYLRGRYLLYPSFRNQSSFSTNFYEEGIHSVPEGMAIRVPNYLREATDSRFTTPLLGREDSRMVWRSLPHTEREVKELVLPVVALNHLTATNGRQDLIRAGEEYAREVANYDDEMGVMFSGWDQRETFQT